VAAPMGFALVLAGFNVFFAGQIHVIISVANMDGHKYYCLVRSISIFIQGGNIMHSRQY
jgi:hypothetical protein